MKQLFAYIRVSDPKQGKGVSLQEQRAAIERCAEQRSFAIVAWFEERQTAAKRGRPVFDEMLRRLRAGEAAGVVIHKIDRSARNLRDWNDLGDLIDAGVDVHFAHEALDLRTRGGRLSADIQAVVAADYIRNLREEALKGIRGRLKQGIYPLQAPAGYLDCGAGVPKKIDPVTGPIVRRLFELYATGEYSGRSLRDESVRLGLRNRHRGTPLRLQSVLKILRNPFYVGLMRMKTRNEIFVGAHEPLITRSLFDRVQAILDGKHVKGPGRHNLLFRRRLTCAHCGKSLIGSRHKGRVYYRCQTTRCPTTCVREDAVEAAVMMAIGGISFQEPELRLLQAQVSASGAAEAAVRRAKHDSLTEALTIITARTSRLTDLMIDGKVDRETFEAKRAELFAERQRIQEGIQAVEAETASFSAIAVQVLELASNAKNLYDVADPARKGRLLDTLISNCTVNGKSLDISLREPFASIATARGDAFGGPRCFTPRTLSAEDFVRIVASCPQVMLDPLQDSEFMKFAQEKVAA